MVIHAVAQTPPPGTIPTATIRLVTRSTDNLLLDGNRIALKTIDPSNSAGLYMIERGPAGWANVPVSLPSPGTPVGKPIAFEGDLLATDTNGGSFYGFATRSMVFERAAGGWRTRTVLQNQVDLVCAGFSPAGVISLVPGPTGIGVYSCVNNLAKVTATLALPPIPQPALLTMALSGDTLVTIYARGDNVSPKIHGYVYERTRDTKGSLWTLRSELPLPAKLATMPAVANSTRAATDGNTIVIGSPKEIMTVSGLGTVEAGAVYLFNRTATGWAFSAKLTQPRKYRHFGKSIAVSGERVLVGTGSQQVFNVQFEPGEAYLYQRVGGVWNQAPNILKSGNVSADVGFGHGVALQGNTAVATSTDGEGGAIYIYSLPNIAPALAR